MRIEQLLFITEIAKSGSISITSKRLHLSPQGISHAIKSLEEELGVKVFDRTRTGLQPTFIGKNLIIRAQEILNKLEEFKEEAYDYSSEIEGRLSISAFYSLCRSIIPHTVAVFKSRFPKINLEIKEYQGSSQVQKSIFNGNADLGLTALSPSFLEENKTLISTHILDSPLMVYFQKDSELAQKTVVSSNDVFKYPIAASTNDPIVEKYHQIFHKHGEPNFLFYSNSNELKKSIVSQGLAIGFENALSLNCDPHIQRGDLIAVPLKEIKEKVSFYCIRLKNQHLSIAGQEFLKEFLVQAKKYKKKISHLNKD